MIKVAMKPIPTLYNGLPTVDLCPTASNGGGRTVRSDGGASGSCGSQAMVAWVWPTLTCKVGGDCSGDPCSWQRYTEMIKWRRKMLNFDRSHGVG